MTSLKNISLSPKNSIKSLRDKALFIEKIYLMNYLVNLRAKKILKTIETEKGPLNKNIKLQCDEYAQDYLKNSKFSPWLYVYSAIQEEFKEGWMPLNYYIEHFTLGMDSIFVKQGSLKPLTNQILDTDLLPDILYVNNGFFIEPHNFQVIPEQKAYDLLFTHYNSVVFKSNNSIEGKGIQFYNKETWNTDQIKHKSGVFQRIIEQHEFFDKILPVPGATIRIVTALDNEGKASVRSAYLRLARLSDKSTHVQSKSNIRIAINITNGELSSTGYLPDWSTTKCHPDSNVSFSGLMIPEFLEACTKVESLHNAFPFISSIGWDLAVNNNNNIEIMEWNTGNNSIEFHEAMHGPCFKDILGRNLEHSIVI